MGSVSLNNLCNSLLSSTADGHRGGGNSDGSHGDSGLSFCLAFVQGFSSLDFIALKGDHAYVLKTVTFEEDIESYSWSSNENLLVIGFQSHFKVLKVTLNGKDLLIEEIFFRKTRSVCKDVKLIGKEKKIIAVGGIQGFELIPMDDPVNVKMIFKWYHVALFAFSPSERLLAIAGLDGQLRILENYLAAKPKITESFISSTRFTCCCFHPKEHKIAVATWDGSVKILEKPPILTETGEWIDVTPVTLASHLIIQTQCDCSGTYLLWSPDGRYLIIASGKVMLFDTEEQKMQYPFGEKGDFAVAGLALLPKNYFILHSEKEGFFVGKFPTESLSNQVTLQDDNYRIIFQNLHAQGIQITRTTLELGQEQFSILLPHLSFKTLFPKTSTQVSNFPFDKSDLDHFSKVPLQGQFLDLDQSNLSIKEDIRISCLPDQFGLVFKNAIYVYSFSDMSWKFFFKGSPQANNYLKGLKIQE